MVIFLWKLQWGVVPTNLLLQRRIILISNRCGWCGVIVESIEHLFWRCELAIWAWSYIGHWWSNYTSLQALGHFSLRKLFNVEKEDGISSIWALIIDLTIWTIWTSRNEAVFEKKRVSRACFEELIFIRINEWGKAGNLMDFGSDPLWKIHPREAVAVHRYVNNMNFWKYKMASYDIVVQ